MNEDDLLQRLWDYQPAIEDSIHADLDRKARLDEQLGSHRTSASPVPSSLVTDRLELGQGRDGPVYASGGHGPSRRTLLLTAAAGVTVLGGVGWALVDRQKAAKASTASPLATGDSAGGTNAAATNGVPVSGAAINPALTGADSTAAGSSTADSTSAPTDPSTVPATDVPTTAPATVPNIVPAIQASPLGRTVKEGSSGSDVATLQGRLRDLHLEPGTTSGSFNHLTTQAVWAFQKLVMQIPAKQATGVVTPDVWAAMQNAVTYTPRKNSSTNTHVEVYVPEQVLVVFKAGVAVLVSHVSTGSGQSWKAAITLDPGTPDNPGATPVTQHILGTSITPGGSYKFAWRFTTGDGWRTGKLGKMYKPLYFNQGVAVHGMTDVPNYPASHGCVRLPMGVTDANNEPKGPNPADIFPSLVSNGDQIFVFTAANATAQGSEAPPYDKPDPAFTTTTAPATTPPTTTAPTAPKTTAPATTTTQPPAISATTPPTAATAPPTTQPPTPPSP